MGGPLGRVLAPFRTLARAPGFTLPAAATLAVGMTAATVVLAVVDPIAFRPLAYPDAGRLAILCEDHPRLAGYCVASPANTEDLGRASSTFEVVGFGRGWPFTLTDAAGKRAVRGGLAAGGFLRALAGRPALGRFFTEDELGPDARVVVLSHAFWTARYGGDPRVLGASISLDGQPHEVVGVLPRGFEAPFDLEGIEVWRAPHFGLLDLDVRGWRGFRAIGRLAPGVSVAAARAELESLYAGLRARHEEIDEEWRLRVEPLRRVVLGDAGPLLLAFLGGGGLLLLLVCANVANLVLARGIDRRRELAVRTALGASRTRLVGALLAESLALSAVATLAALPLAAALARLSASLAPPEIPRLEAVALDGRIVAIVAALSLGVTALFAVLPAARLTERDPGRIVRGGGRAGEERSSARLRNVLVAFEVGLAVVLLSGAGVLARSFARYVAWEPGFERAPLVAVSLFADLEKHAGREAWTALFRRVEARVAALPGVASVATASAGPLFGGGDGATPFRTGDAEPSSALPAARWHDVGPGYFRTLGVEVVRGREIEEGDAEGSPPVAVVNEALARAAWPDGHALGRRILLPEMELAFEVVGVVADVAPLVPGGRPAPEIYWSNRQLGRPATFLLVRSTGDPAALAPALAGEILQVDPDLSVGTPRSLSAHEARALVRPRFQVAAVGLLALAALLLAGAGVHAVVGYSVTRRVREMGIRAALGARPADLVGGVVAPALRFALLGVVAGVAAAVPLLRALRATFPGVPPGDPVSLAAAAATLAASALLAALRPARRAGRVDPVIAIREE